MDAAERLVRDGRVVSIWRFNPTLTLEEIGSRLHVTRERIRQILREQLGADFRHEQTVRKAAAVVVRSAAVDDDLWQKLWSRAKLDRRCLVCGGLNLRGRLSLCCSVECSHDLSVARRYLDPTGYQRHRDYLAKCDRKAGRMSKYVLQPAAPPNRRYAWSPAVREVLARRRPDLLAQLDEGIQSRRAEDRSLILGLLGSDWRPFRSIVDGSSLSVPVVRAHLWRAERAGLAEVYREGAKVDGVWTTIVLWRLRPGVG